MKHVLARILKIISKSGDLKGGYRAANGEITLKFSDSLVFVGTSCRPR
jgi:hypothetical protein